MKKIFWMAQLGHVDELLQVVEPGEGEGEVLLLDLIDDLLELNCKSPFSHFHSLDRTLFSRCQSIQQAVRRSHQKSKHGSKPQLHSSH